MTSTHFNIVRFRLAVCCYTACYFLLLIALPSEAMAEKFAFRNGMVSGEVSELDLGKLCIEFYMAGESLILGPEIDLSQKISHVFRNSTRWDLALKELGEAYGFETLYIGGAVAILPPVSANYCRNRMLRQDHNSEFAGEKIALELYDNDIINIFKIISEVSGTPISCRDDISGMRITVLQKYPRPWNEILDTLLIICRLRAEAGDNKFTIYPDQGENFELYRKFIFLSEGELKEKRIMTGIYLKDQRFIPANLIWVEGNLITYQKYGQSIGIPSDKVDKIIMDRVNTRSESPGPVMTGMNKSERIRKGRNEKDQHGVHEVEVPTQIDNDDPSVMIILDTIKLCRMYIILKENGRMSDDMFWVKGVAGTQEDVSNLIAMLRKKSRFTAVELNYIRPFGGQQESRHLLEFMMVATSITSNPNPGTAEHRSMKDAKAERTECARKEKRYRMVLWNYRQAFGEIQAVHDAMDDYLKCLENTNMSQSMIDDILEQDFKKAMLTD